MFSKFLNCQTYTVFNRLFSFTMHQKWISTNMSDLVSSLQLCIFYNSMLKLWARSNVNLKFKWTKSHLIYRGKSTDRGKSTIDRFCERVNQNGDSFGRQPYCSRYLAYKWASDYQTSILVLVKNHRM